MKFLIKEISPSRKELRVTLDPCKTNTTSYYNFGSINKTFDEGTIKSEYIPKEHSGYYSIGPNPATIRLVTAYLKDTIGSPIASKNTVLVINNENYTIVNIAVDDINLVSLTSNTIPSFVVKLLNPLPPSVNNYTEISIQRQILTTQEQDVYFISADEAPAVFTGLAYDETKIEDIGDADLQKTNPQSYNQLTSSFMHSDDSIITNTVSSSDINLKLSYNKFEDHIHFGSAVNQLENFKNKIISLEDNLSLISQSLSTGSSQDAVVDTRKNLFNNITTIKNSFTPYEKYLYYKSDLIPGKYQANIGANYTSTDALKTTNAKKVKNSEGFGLVYHTSGSTSGSGKIDLFRGKYNVEDKPFYNHSGSFYLSFLMRGDESIKNSVGSGVNNIKWDNYQENYTPKLPKNTLHTSSLLEPNTTSSFWQRYIYEASASYWAPHSSNPIIGTAGTITEFSNDNEITFFSGSGVTGSYPIQAGGRYSNLATYVTASGRPFTGSISPAGELFRIYVDTNFTTDANAVTSSYLTDIKITKYNPTNVLPFSEVYSTGSNEWSNWYNEQYESASSFDRSNPHSLMKTLPSFFGDDRAMDNSEFRKLVNMMGEHFDIARNYIENYETLFKTQYGEVGNAPDNLLPVMAENYNWQFMLPFGKKSDSDLMDFMGSTLSNLNTTANVKNNIWRNVVNNVKYMYKTKGTKNSVHALLNSYGFPPNILKIKEHGASLDSNEIVSSDVSNLKEGIAGSTGSLSFTQKEDKLVSYVMDTGSRVIKSSWGINDVDASGVEFVFKPSKGSNEQVIVKSSGSLTSSLWEIVLEPSASSTIKSRIQFRLNNSLTGSLDLNDASNRVSMSSDWYDFKNQNFWNVLVQRATSSAGMAHLTTVTQSYNLYIGEQGADDKIKVFDVISMSLHSQAQSCSNANFIGTGSRHPLSSSNLYIGHTMTGSIAEFRTWKNALSGSVFRQHIFDKKSAVGNSVTDSQTNLIYHYRLNENWASGSSNAKIKDYNPNNVKDYSLDISNSALAHYPLYDTDTFDRIQFSVGVGGAYEPSDNNILIDLDRRFINNLNPFEPSVMNAYHPLINKRKASSVLELTRSPQEVINDFILNQLGNFDFNDKFADPQDIGKDVYEELEDFAKDFFDYYDISMDVNKYINAQAAIFNKGLLKSLKRLIPARAVFGKIGVELKPTLLERQKLPPATIEKEILNFEGSIKYADTGKDISDWESNTFLGKTLDTLYPADLTKNAGITFSTISGSEFYTYETELWESKLAHIELTSPTGSKDYDFTDQYELYDTHLSDFELAHMGTKKQWGKKYYDFTTKHTIRETFDGTIETSNASGSIIWNFEENLPLYESKETTLNIASSTGSVSFDFTKNQPLYSTKETTLNIASSTGSVSFDFTKNEDLYKNNDLEMLNLNKHFNSDNKSNYINYTQQEHKNKNASIAVASESGSIAWNFTDNELLHSSKDYTFDVASSTGSITWNFDKDIPLYSITDINKVFETSNYYNSSSKNLIFRNEIRDDRNLHIEVASHTGSNPTLSEYENIYPYLDSDIVVANETGSVYNFTDKEPIPSTKNGKLDISLTNDLSDTSSYHYNNNVYDYKNTHIVLASATGSNPEIINTLTQPYEGTFHYMGNTEFNEHLDKSYSNILDKWGRGDNDTKFIHYGYAGRDGDYNTYHLESRYLFYTIGDVERVSGSYSGSIIVNQSLESGHFTDYTGTVTSGKYTASIDFQNQLYIETNKGLGLRPLGTTVSFKPTGSIDFKGGKFLDETFVYPANHQYIIGSSKDSIDRLIYKGTQNTGGDIIESEAFDDLFEEAFYHVLTPGANQATAP